MYSTIQVDGITYHMICDIKRTAVIKSSDLSGLLLDKTYFNDVIGTYLEYTVNMVVPYGYENEYTSLYEVLTNPSASHTVVVPYNQTTTTIIGRITVVSDELMGEETRGNATYKIWRKTSFKIIANSPIKAA